MNLCDCRRPLRATPASDKLRCDHCGGLTPYGRPWSLTRAQRAQTEATSLLAQLVNDIPWDLTPHRPETTGRRGIHEANPTLDGILDTRTLAAHHWRQAASRLAERALLYLRMADQAAGEALLAVDNAPAQRAEGTWYPQLVVEAEVERGKHMQAKRRARGEL